MEKDPIIHKIKRQKSNNEMENRDILVNLYLKDYRKHHPKTSYRAYDKKIQEANKELKGKWGKLKLGQEIKIPMDIPKEAPEDQEPAKQDSAQNTSPENTTEASKKEEEKEASQDSGKPSKAGIYPVCNGAECMCDQSKEKLPAKLKVISHESLAINDKNGTSKLLATTNDLLVPFEKQSNTFGTCLKQPLGFGQYKPCIPNITKWDKSYEAIKVASANNGTALLEESEGECAFTGKITFTTHGQTQAVSSADAAETSPGIAAMLTDGVITEEEAEKLIKGTLEDKKTKKITDINVVGSLSPTNGTYRINVDYKELVFRVAKPTGLKADEKAGINWAVYVKNKKGYSHYHNFVDKGDQFVFPYRTPGIYAIEAYSDTKKFDILTGNCKGSASNLLEIVYQDIAGLSLYGNEEERTKKKLIRPTETITVSATKLFKEAYHVKNKNIQWEVSSKGEDIDFTKTTKQVTFGDNKTDIIPEITIKPQHNTDIKKITVSATYDGQTKSITFIVKNNAVARVSSDKDTICVLSKPKKPRHEVTFTAHYQLPYNAALGDVAPQWCWYNKSESPHKKNLITSGVNGLTYTSTSEKEGIWYVEAFASGPDGTNAKITALQPKISKTYWADSEGGIVSRTGYGHKVFFHIEGEALHGETLQLKLWQETSKDVKEIDCVELEFKKPSGREYIKLTLPKADANSKNTRLFCTLTAIGNMKILGTKEAKDELKGQLLLVPKEKMAKLEVRIKKQVLSLKIYEQNNDLHIGIITYGDTVTIKVKTRNLIGETLEFEIWHDKRADNYTDNYSLIDKTDDNEMEETVSIPIDSEGNGEGNFCIPDSWKSNQKNKVTPEYYYFKYGKEEFPRAYYYINPKLVNEKKEQKDKAKIDVGALSTDYIVHPRIKALMLKVADKLTLDDKIEEENAVILSDELELESNEKEKCSKCEEDVTLKQIEDIFETLSKHKSFRQEIIDNFNKYAKKESLHLNTCLRKAHFFAQVGAETLGIHPDWMVETDVFPYISKNIKQSLFGTRAVNLKSSGNLESYCTERPQQKLLNYLYAKENGFGNGNGNEASGDGYKFRGRGLKQLTGRANYKTASKFLKDIFPDEYVDLEANPDKIKEAKYAVLSAIAYWEKNSVWQVADQIKEVTDKNVKRVRRKINGGIAGWKEVKTYLEEGIDVFKVNNCVPVSVSVKDCSVCKENHYDLTDKIKWQTQFDSKWGDKKAQNVACKKTCDDILVNAGLKATSKFKLFQTANENSTHTQLITDINQSKRAITYINAQLSIGNPVQLGVNHKLGYGYNEGTTDHFVVLIGKGCESGKVFYRFYDVGTSHENKGASKNNKLFLNTTDYSLKGTTVYNGSTYVVTQVRNN